MTIGPIIKMLKKALLKQNGFTLIEILVAMAIHCGSVTAVITFYRTFITINTNINNEADATNQLKNAFNYISRDTEQAAAVTTTSSNFPLTLSWGQNTANPTTVTYSIVNGTILQRYYTGPNGQSTMNVANNVNSNAAKTNCSWDSTNYDLT